MISVRDVHLSFKIKERFSENGFPIKQKYVEILKGVSFDIKPGEVVGIIGNNGAGKSTILQVLAGIIAPDKGSVVINNRSIALLALGKGVVPEIDGISNIYLFGLQSGFTKKQIKAKLDDIVAFSELGNMVYQPVECYSSGMKTKLMFSAAVFLCPEIMLLDEVFGVGDHNFKIKSTKKITEIIKDGKHTVLLVSHNMGTISKVCDKVLWIEKGKVKMFDETEKVIAGYNETFVKE